MRIAVPDRQLSHQSRMARKVAQRLLPKPDAMVAGEARREPPRPARGVYQRR
jgi:hypothetical protein